VDDPFEGTGGGERSTASFIDPLCVFPTGERIHLNSIIETNSKAKDELSFPAVSANHFGNVAV
jgi:hypothetical protein